MRRQKGNIDYEKDIEKVTDMGICFCQQKLKKNMKCFYIFFKKKKRLFLLAISLQPVKLLYFHKIVTIPGFKVTWDIVNFFRFLPPQITDPSNN